MDQLPQLPPPHEDWRDYLTFFFACLGIVSVIISAGLGLVWLWELI